MSLRLVLFAIDSPGLCGSSPVPKLVRDFLMYVSNRLDNRRKALFLFLWRDVSYSLVIHGGNIRLEISFCREPEQITACVESESEDENDHTAYLPC
ncbi:hypothetical protein F5B21DRAFT_482049 [Xylaria acuta]|nr:hypothetical protein F5B21DRAFT_482049 [Xylaria acuta]